MLKLEIDDFYFACCLLSVPNKIVRKDPIHTYGLKEHLFSLKRVHHNRYLVSHNDGNNVMIQMNGRVCPIL